MSKKMNGTRKELKHIARTLNTLIDNLGFFAGDLEIHTTVPNKLSDNCRNMQQELIEYRVKLLQMLGVEA